MGLQCKLAKRIFQPQFDPYEIGRPGIVAFSLDAISLRSFSHRRALHDHHLGSTMSLPRRRVSDGHHAALETIGHLSGKAHEGVLTGSLSRVIGITALMR